MKAQRIAVTGGAGFIGQNLVRTLLARSSSTHVTVIDSDLYQTSCLLPRDEDRLEYLKFSLLDRKETERFFSQNPVDILVNLAARAGVTESISDPRLNFEANVVANFNLLDVARLYGVKLFVFASTGGAIIGDGKPPLTEDMTPNPLSPYGVSKLIGELYTKVFELCYSLKSCCLRFSNVYGEYSAHKHNLIPMFIKSAIEGSIAQIYGDGTQERDFIYVGDLVDGILQVLERDVSGVIQLATGKNTSANTIAELVTQELSGKHEFTWEFRPARPGEVYKTWCDNSKSIRLLGHYPKTTLSEGLRKTIHWYVEQYKKDGEN